MKAAIRNANCGINWHEIQAAIESLFSNIIEEAPKLEEEA